MRRRVLILIAVTLTALPTACAVSRAPGVAAAPDPATLRATPAGELIGESGRYGNHEWLGIPFAVPPVGNLRWRAPQPAERWTGLREALEFGAVCPQIASPLGEIAGARPGQVIGAEDCLTLNVYAPALQRGEIPRARARLPVMLWIHGGGNTSGTARFYNGGNLAAREQLIVVTTNYRLGPLGWFRHPALRDAAATPADASGNYAILDLIRALEWVRENISAFGGDPGNVTIFGESAGGTNVMALLLSPLAKGLFHRAILQSPGMGTSSIAEAEDDRVEAERGALSSRQALLRLLVQDGTSTDPVSARERIDSMGNPEIASYLNAKSDREILEVYRDALEGGKHTLPRVIRDGDVLPLEEPKGLFEAGRYNLVPVLLGSNRDENKLFMYRDPASVRKLLGLFPRLRNREAYNARSQYRARMWKAAAIDEPASLLHKAQGPSVFAYRFDWDEEPSILGADLSVMLGAAHGFEIPFVFGHFYLGRAAEVLFEEENAAGREALAHQMMSYWGEFAYRGDPGRGRDGNLPRWAPWDDSSPTSGRFMVLDTDEDGGTRMSYETLTRARVLAEMSADPRLAVRQDRCSLVRELAEWWGEFGEAERAAAGCSGPTEVAAPLTE